MCLGSVASANAARDYSSCSLAANGLRQPMHWRLELPKLPETAMTGSTGWTGHPTRDHHDQHIVTVIADRGVIERPPSGTILSPRSF